MQNVRAVTGYKFEEVVGRSWPEVFLPEEFRHEGLSEFRGVGSHASTRSV